MTTLHTISGGQIPQWWMSIFSPHLREILSIHQNLDYLCQKIIDFVEMPWLHNFNLISAHVFLWDSADDVLYLEWNVPHWFTYFGLYKTQDLIILLHIPLWNGKLHILCCPWASFLHSFIYFKNKNSTATWKLLQFLPRPPQDINHVILYHVKFS